MAIDFGTIIVGGLMAMGNFGGLIFLGKNYMKRVDKHDEILPKMVANLDANTKAVSDLYSKYDEMNTEFSGLRGEHKVNHRFKHHSGDVE